jgi:hypothetical protein
MFLCFQRLALQHCCQHIQSLQLRWAHIGGYTEYSFLHSEPPWGIVAWYRIWDENCKMQRLKSVRVDMAIPERDIEDTFEFLLFALMGAVQDQRNIGTFEVHTSWESASPTDFEEIDKVWPFEVRRGAAETPGEYL